GLVDEVSLLTDIEQENLRNSVHPVKLVLTKLRKLGFKIIHSTVKLLLAWHEILEALKMRVTTLQRDVSTRWNLTFDMVEYALRHREAIDAVTQRRDLGLRQLELTDHEWVIAEQLRDVLKTLNRYYQLTDTLEVYRIAMVLHPCHKLTYFRRAKWEDTWIETAETLVQETFERSYS
ncbi:hypothetical protein C8R48DRAFT_564865, partial [Suillus tomentosus]